MSDSVGNPVEVVAGRYAIERELGRGGSAVVYLARDLFDTRDDPRVALKLLHQEFSGSKAAERFSLEVRLLRDFSHPSILPVTDAGEWQGRQYYVMPFVDGESLQERLRRERRLSFNEVVRIGQRLCEALAYAHARKVVHRDVKPANVMLAGDAVYLTDFGVAKALEPIEGAPHSTTGVARGTRAYMSPEQVTADRDLDHRSDIFSLGCVLYEMIAGVRPFYSADEARELMRRLMEAPDPLSRHRDGVPEGLERVVMKALAREPADRWGSVGEVGVGLGGIAAPVRVPPRPRGNWKTAVGALAVIALLTASTLAVLNRDPASASEQTADASASLPDFAIVALEAQRSAQLSDTSPSVVNRLAAGIEDRLSRWRGLSLHAVAPRDVAEAARALGDRSAQGAPPSIRARRVAALQEVWRDDGWTVTMRIFDEDPVASGGSVSASIDRSDPTSIAHAADRLSAALIARPGASFVDDGTSGTSSFRALRAYQEGSIQLSEWRLSDAAASFKRALTLDPQFGAAHLWLAQTRAWNSEGGAEAAASAERSFALLSRDPLRAREHAEALRDLLRSDYEKACQRFAALSVNSPDWLPAHIGYGDCLLRDPAVVADDKTLSGWRFRSSWGDAFDAFSQALALAGVGATAEIAYRRALSSLITQGGRIRLGVGAVNPADSFAALPSVVDDKVRLIPFPLQDLRRGAPHTVPETMSRALLLQRNTALRIAYRWARTDTTNAQARWLLLQALDMAGELTDGSGGYPSALAEVRGLRRRPPAGVSATRLMNTELRILLKQGRYSTASALADTMLSARGATAPEDAALLAPVAALRGDIDRASALLAESSASSSESGDEGGSDTPPELRRAVARIVVLTSLGYCGAPLDSAGREVEMLAAAFVEPHRANQWRSSELGRWKALQTPCVLAIGHPRTPAAELPLSPLQRALWMNDDEGVRRAWRGTLELRRGADASTIALTDVLQEAWILASVGMRAEAQRHLDASIAALPRSSEKLTTEVEQLLSFIGVLALRDNLRSSGHAVGDRFKPSETIRQLVGERNARLLADSSWWFAAFGAIQRGD